MHGKSVERGTVARVGNVIIVILAAATELVMKGDESPCVNFVPSSFYKL